MALNILHVLKTHNQFRNTKTKKYPWHNFTEKSEILEYLRENNYDVTLILNGINVSTNKIK